MKKQNNRIKGADIAIILLIILAVAVGCKRSGSYKSRRINTRTPTSKSNNPPTSESDDTPTSDDTPSLDRALDAKWKFETSSSTLEMWSENHTYTSINQNSLVENGSYKILDEGSFELTSDSGASIIWHAKVNGDSMVISNSRGTFTLNKIK